MSKLLIVGFVFLLLFSIGVNNVILSENGRSQTQLETGQATPIQEGVMTPKQREHSKIYQQYTGRTKITELVTRNKEFKIVIKSEPQPTSIQDLACEADSIIIGTIQSKASQLTEEKDFIFTDYDITVEEVLKDNSTNPINRAALITVTRPGGVIELKSKIVHAEDEAFKPFQIYGSYILFLHHLPVSNSYQTVNSSGNFQLKDRRVFQRRKDQLLDDTWKNETDVGSFVSKVQTALALCEAEKGTTSR